MYRVELKVLQRRKKPLSILRKFLMYRVELKVGSFHIEDVLFFLVPNVPCGVESVELKD